MTLPVLKWTPSPNYSSRIANPIRLVIVHDCEGNYEGSINWFAQKISQVSAHFVLKEDGSECTQMVPLDQKAWHACDFNSESIGLEIAGFAKAGFSSQELQSAAEIVAFLLKIYNLPPVWAHRGVGLGFTSHYDLGVAGGGHYDPTTDTAVWQAFVTRVQNAYNALGTGPLPSWGAIGLHPSLPPPKPTSYTPIIDIRKEYRDICGSAPVGSVLWIQQQLNKNDSSLHLLQDGLMGSQTKNALINFQKSVGITDDGIFGPITLLKLELV